MDVLQDYPQRAVHAGAARGRGGLHGRRLRAADAAAGVRRAAHRAGAGQRAGHDAQRAHRQDAAGGVRRAVAEPRAAPGAAPVRAAGGDGAADRASGRRRSSTRTTSRARCAARSRSPPSRRRGRSFWRCRWTCWTAKPTWTSSRRRYTNWRARPDAAALAEIAGHACRGRAADADGRRLVSVCQTRRPRRRAWPSCSGAPIFECYASEFNVPDVPPAESGQRRLRLAQGDPRARWRTATCCSWSARRVFQLIFPDAEQAGPGPRTRAGAARLLRARAGQERAARMSRCWAIRKPAWPSWPSCSRSAWSDARAEAARRAARAPRPRVAQTHERYWAARAQELGRRADSRAAADARDQAGAARQRAGLLRRRDQRQARRDGDRAASGPGQLVKVRGGGHRPGPARQRWAPRSPCPDRKVVGVCSDGAAMYSITALWTAAHHRIPVTYVMLSNRAYRILKLNMLEYLGAAAAGPRVRGHGPARARAALRPHGRGHGRAPRGAWSGRKTWRPCSAKPSPTRADHSWWTCRSNHRSPDHETSSYSADVSSTSHTSVRNPRWAAHAPRPRCPCSAQRGRRPSGT